MKIGAHISTAKPFSDAVTRAESIGCECMQIFANAPQRWNPTEISDAEIKKYLKLNEKAKISPVIIHSIYLVNLASENPFFYEQSIKSLIDDMNKATKLGALGANMHLGSTKGKDMSEVLVKVADAVKQVLTATDEKTLFIIENSAGAGNIIGDTLEEILLVMKAVDSPRVRVLIDTAHAFESGYDLRTEKQVDEFVEKFDQLIGIDKLVGFHLNDSKTALNSKRDRHADLGVGEIGLETFRFIVNHPKLQHCFGILETPQETSSWQEQIKLLKSFEKK
jgi:deoxyribonuclease-4